MLHAAHHDTKRKAPARAASRFPRLHFALGMATWEMRDPQPCAVFTTAAPAVEKTSSTARAWSRSAGSAQRDSHAAVVKEGASCEGGDVARKRLMGTGLEASAATRPSQLASSWLQVSGPGWSNPHGL